MLLIDFCRKKLHLFRVVGQFIAKAMLDSRIIDMSFNKVFLKLVIGEDVPVTIDTLKVKLHTSYYVMFINQDF
jgi:E3 ubiquitin-protein ligase TRIP12